MVTWGHMGSVHVYVQIFSCAATRRRQEILSQGRNGLNRPTPRGSTQVSARTGFQERYKVVVIDSEEPEYCRIPSA